mgnify:CR=1 FL=1
MRKKFLVDNSPRVSAQSDESTKNYELLKLLTRNAHFLLLERLGFPHKSRQSDDFRNGIRCVKFT